MSREAQVGDKINVLTSGMKMVGVTLEEELEPGYWKTSDPVIKVSTNDHQSNQIGGAALRLGTWEFDE